MSRARLFRTHRKHAWGTEPGIAPEFVPRTEHEETRRAARDWLRERDDDDAPELDRDDDYDSDIWAV